MIAVRIWLAILQCLISRCRDLKPKASADSEPNVEPKKRKIHNREILVMLYLGNANFEIGNGNPGIEDKSESFIISRNREELIIIPGNKREYEYCYQNLTFYRSILCN